MATRQRLRAVLDIRRASRPCWRCALNLSRHTSTSAASTEASSESMSAIFDNRGGIHDNLMRRYIDSKLKSIRPNTQSSSAEVATIRSDESNGHSSQTVHERSAGAVDPPSFRKWLSLPSYDLDPHIRPYIGKEPLTPAIEYNTGAPLVRRHLAKEHPSRVTALARKKIFTRSQNNTLAPLVRRYTAKEHEKIFTHFQNNTLAPLVRRYFAAKEHPSKITALARKKIFTHFQNNTLAPLIHKCILEFSPPTTEHSVPRKVFAEFVRDNLARITPQSQSVEVVGKPRIRAAIDGRQVALPIQPQSEWKQAARQPNALEEVTREEVIPRKVLSDTVTRKVWGNPPRFRTEDTSEARDEDEPSSDEMASWLDELQALVLDTPNITTTNGCLPSSPHSSPQYPARPPASSWNPTSTRQSLKYSKMSFSTWSSKVSKKYYATAAVSNNCLLSVSHMLKPSTESDFADCSSNRSTLN